MTRYAHITGWGMAVPERVMTNDDLSKLVDTNDEWIRSRTGIKERRIAGVKETTTTLAIEAAQRALEVANILPSEVDLVIVATSPPSISFRRRRHWCKMLLAQRRLARLICMQPALDSSTPSTSPHKPSAAEAPIRCWSLAQRRCHV